MRTFVSWRRRRKSINSHFFFCNASPHRYLPRASRHSLDMPSFSLTVATTPLLQDISTTTARWAPTPTAIFRPCGVSLPQKFWCRTGTSLWRISTHFEMRSITAALARLCYSFNNAHGSSTGACLYSSTTHLDVTWSWTCFCKIGMFFFFFSPFCKCV